MTDVTITHRPLKPSEAETLHQELKSTPNILGFTVRELVRMQDVQVAEDNGVFAGAALTFDLPLGWTEIAAVYVLPRFRGLGLGKGLLHASWDRATIRERHIYMLSRNTSVVEWMRGQGMTISGNPMLAPFAVQIWMPVYMASRHRWMESLRKSREIRKCPSMVQGIKKREAKKSIEA
ncbi:MAG: GNAT family N-acetyltransferase [Capsulimonas sp.]|uniref:GNAT family N-acetyltransferase n=1 Tax=Capsulimonas sp. TaxID=2494211 RepID=UPI0032672A62